MANPFAEYDPNLRSFTDTQWKPWYEGQPRQTLAYNADIAAENKKLQKNELVGKMERRAPLSFNNLLQGMGGNGGTVQQWLNSTGSTAAKNVAKNFTLSQKGYYVPKALTGGGYNVSLKTAAKQLFNLPLVNKFWFKPKKRSMIALLKVMNAQNKWKRSKKSFLKFIVKNHASLTDAQLQKKKIKLTINWIKTLARSRVRLLEHSLEQANAWGVTGTNTPMGKRLVHRYVQIWEKQRVQGPTQMQKTSFALVNKALDNVMAEKNGDETTRDTALTRLANQLAKEKMALYPTRQDEESVPVESAIKKRYEWQTGTWVDETVKGYGQNLYGVGVPSRLTEEMRRAGWKQTGTPNVQYETRQLGGRTRTPVYEEEQERQQGDMTIEKNR